jgi:formylglycine-generating enzyme required for sulfatase activity
MQFVSFGRTNALMCIWETRNCDYELFARNTGRAWREDEFGRFGPQYPVVMVSFEEAKAFCNWLTAKEQSENLIGSNWVYRLPTDLEWGKALGLSRERGKTPVERLFYGGPALPWGEIWPPPANYANLGVKLGIDEWKYTSPVASFAPNRYGIFDMVGNVMEWCDELYDPSNPQCANQYSIRGSSYASKARGECAASVRLAAPSKNCMSNLGFRCVLSTAAATERAD